MRDKQWDNLSHTARRLNEILKAMGVDGIRIRRGSGPYECEQSYLCPSFGCELYNTLDILSHHLSNNACGFPKFIDSPNSAKTEHMVCRQHTALHAEADYYNLNGNHDVTENNTIEKNGAIDPGAVNSNFQWASELEGDNSSIQEQHIPKFPRNTTNAVLNSNHSGQFGVEHSNSSYSFGQKSVSSGSYTTECESTEVDGCNERVTISLADYLDAFKQSDNSKRVGIDRRLPCTPRMTRMPEWSKKIDATTQAKVGADAPILNGDKENETKTDQWKTEEYLIKRRAFLRIQLVERYTELIQLLKKEVSLTGKAPMGYEQAIREYECAKLVVDRMYEQSEWLTINFPRETLDPETKQAPKRHQSIIDLDISGPTDPMTRTRSLEFLHRKLQPTSYVISPLAIYRAHAGDGRNVVENYIGHRSQLLHCNISRSCSAAHSVGQNADFESLTPIKSNSRSSVYSISDLKITNFPRRKSKLQSLRLKKFRKSEQLGQNRIAAISLFDLTNDSTEDKGDICTQSNKTLRSSSGCRSSIMTDTSINEKHMNINSESERQQLIAWVDVELDTVRQIMQANLRFAKGSKKNKEAAKMYNKAAEQNRRTIERLEHQRSLIRNQIIHDYDMTSIGSLRSNISTDSASHYDVSSTHSAPFNNSPLMEKSADNASPTKKLDHESTILQPPRFRRKTASNSNLSNIYDGLVSTLPNLQLDDTGNTNQISPPQPPAHQKLSDHSHVSQMDGEAYLNESSEFRSDISQIFLQEPCSRLGMRSNPCASTLRRVEDNNIPSEPKSVEKGQGLEVEDYKDQESGTRTNRAELHRLEEEKLPAKIILRRSSFASKEMESRSDIVRHQPTALRTVKAALKDPKDTTAAPTAAFSVYSPPTYTANRHIPSICISMGEAVNISMQMDKDLSANTALDRYLFRRHPTASKPGTRRLSCSDLNDVMAREIAPNHVPNSENVQQRMFECVTSRPHRNSMSPYNVRKIATFVTTPTTARTMSYTKWH